jgi:peptidyl-tRNA hydrolase
MAKWVKEAIITHQVDRTLHVANDLLLLSVPPSFTALSYKKMKACKNHFKIDDEQNNLLVTYDSSVASIF